VPDIARLSAVTAAIALSSLSNAAILTDQSQIPFVSAEAQRLEQLDVAGYSSIPVPSEMGAIAQNEAAQVLSEFATKLAANMQPAPAEVHREVAERPWDFV